MDKNPCPQRIFDDTGSAFTMGCVCGGAFHFLKGIKNAPKGARISGGLKSLAMRGPVLGGNFAVWSGIHTAIDCSLIKIRGKEDPINGILSGFLTGGLLAFRGGLKASWNSAFFGGVVLSFIESFSIYMSQKFALRQNELLKTPLPPLLSVARQKGTLKELKTYDRDRKLKEFDFVPEIQSSKKM